MQLLEEDRKKIRGALDEISNSFTRVEAERDLIKSVINDLNTLFKIPKKTLNKMAKAHHKQNFNEEVATNEEFEELYQTVTGISSE